MGSHTNLKIGKIIEELVTYLLNKGHTDIKFETIKEEKKIKITFKVRNCSEKVVNKLTDLLKCKDEEDDLEEYGWALIGESDHSSELELVSMLIEKLEIYQDGEYTIFKMCKKRS